MKMYEILNLSNVFLVIKDEKMPIKTAYKFSKLMKKADEERQFYAEKLQEILEEYGEKDESGSFIYLNDEKSLINIKKGKEEECQQKTKELQDLEIDFSNIKFTLDELKNTKMTIENMMSLMPFIEE